jgi:hypothetical protein
VTLVEEDYPPVNVKISRIMSKYSKAEENEVQLMNEFETTRGTLTFTKSEALLEANPQLSEPNRFEIIPYATVINRSKKKMTIVNNINVS